MGIFDSISRGFGPKSDEELEEEREAVRQRYVSTTDINEADRLYRKLHSYDAVMTDRANEAYERENPNAETRYREHGWYLPNDD